MTYAEYLKKVKAINNPYWNKSFEARWNYLKHVASEINLISPNRTLEIGPNRLSLTSCDTLALSIDDVDRDNLGNRVFIHDAAALPWDVSDKHYDLVIALQVFEHLTPNQAIIFSEIVRVSKKCILSIPYKWNCPDDPVHHGIDDAMISIWTNGHVPYKRVIASGRLILFYNFQR